MMFPSNTGEGALAPSLFPPKTGISLKPCYFQTIFDSQPDVGFFEIHAENYLSSGSPNRLYLEHIRTNYPITIHGVGLSIGGESPLNLDHLHHIAALVNEFDPIVFSEHLAWSTHNQHFLNDLLPLPYSQATLNQVCAHINQVQDTLDRAILLENPATYLQFDHNEMSETEFITEITRKTGCYLLLDLNNVEVSCFNHQHDPIAYLQHFPLHRVRQIHLAGYHLDNNPIQPLKIDTHNQPVSSEVWALFEWVSQQQGDIGTLIEWDANLPPLDTLLAQADLADEIRHRVQRGII